MQGSGRRQWGGWEVAEVAEESSAVAEAEVEASAWCVEAASLWAAECTPGSHSAVGCTEEQASPSASCHLLSSSKSPSHLSSNLNGRFSSPESKA